MTEMELAQQERSMAGKIPRMAIERFIHDGKPPEEEVFGLENTARLREPMGVFVTLKKDKKLRGCVGHITPLGPLWKELRDVAVLSATKDTRFSPVTAGELSQITISITVLTLPRPIADPFEFEVGVHGIIFEAGKNRSVFLPQVAPEWGWDKETTFRQLARKARLHDDAWKDPTTHFSLFRGQVFDEFGALTS